MSPNKFKGTRINIYGKLVVCPLLFYFLISFGNTYQRDIYYNYYYDKKTKKKYDKEETTKRI